MLSHSPSRLGHQQTAKLRRRLVVSGLCAILTAGCPQLLEDEFQKQSTPSTEGTGGETTTTNGSSVGGTLNLDSTASASTGGGNGEAGADPDTSTPTTTSSSVTTSDSGGTGGSSGSGGNGGSGGATTTGSPPALLVYATDAGDVLVRPWQGTSFGSPVVWNTLGETVAFVDARLHPNRQSGLVAYQTEAGSQCSLWVHLHNGTESQTPEEIPLSTGDDCLTTKSFDLAYEHVSGAGMLVYAADETTLEYRTITDQQLSDANVIDRDGATSAVHWLRLSAEQGSDRIALGHTASNTVNDSLVAFIWDGDAWSPPGQIALGGPVLGSQSFDLEFGDELLAVRADDSDDGVDYAWFSGGDWTDEELLEGAPGWDVTLVELMRTPEGIAGIAVDTLGDNGRLGAFFHDGETFTEAVQLDLTLPPTSELRPATLKADLGLMGDSIVAVYPTDYVNDSAIGWAVRQAGSTWTLMEGEEPDLEQLSRGAVPWSMRLAPLPGPDAGLILTFAEEQGLYFTYLTNLGEGWATPVLVDAEVLGSEFTPFDVSSVD